MTLTNVDLNGAFLVLCSVLVAIIHYTRQQRVERNRVHTSALSGIGFMAELVVESGREIRDLLRMDYITFRRITTVLQEQNLICSSRYISAEEQVAIFLLTVGNNSRNRIVQNRFQHSGSTISRYFHRVLHAICQLYPKYVVMPSTESETPDLIRYNARFFPYFKDCIGAVDGCHVPINVPRDSQIRYRNRKGFCSQSVMAAVGVDMRFHYVLAGWEGSAADSTILNDALSRPSGRFIVPEGRYYLVDAGYANTRSFLAPFRGVRYHLSEYVGGNNPRNPRELFNHRHASLRNVVERTFGVWKGRFPILKIATRGYDITTQVKIVIATTVLHNFILIEGGRGDELCDDEIHDDPMQREIMPLTSTQSSQREESQMGSALRESLMAQMWSHR